MRKANPYLTVMLLVASSLAVGPSARGNAPPKRLSPPGQVKIVTVNAHQRAILGIKRFTAMLELGKALRSRPAAFDGGFRGGVAAPDVFVTEEWGHHNLDIFEHLLKQRFGSRYKIIGSSNTAAALIANTDRVTAIGDPMTWEDACVPGRTYQYATFAENTSGAQFTVAGVHFEKNYTSTGQSNCLPRNVTAIRTLLTTQTVPVIVGGDFNHRSVETPYECDPDERSTALGWWSTMTAPDPAGRAFSDDVRQWHRAHGQSMADDWTQEQYVSSPTCDGASRFRRTRIDYLFSTGAIVAEAHADHPGWAGVTPGLRSATNYKYSDHRFVWGRYVLAGPAQPSAPTATPDEDGVIHVAWNAVDTATSYVVYRAIEGHPYDDLAHVDAPTTFEDVFTEDGTRYTYAIAAVGSDGGQGLESTSTGAIADATGPHVTGVRPHREKRAVDPGTSLDVFLDESATLESVDQDSVQLYLGDRRIQGRVTRKTGRHITLNPARRLKEGKTYTAIFVPVKDALGNRGGGFVWHFTTVLPPPPKHHHKHP